MSYSILTQTLRGGPEIRSGLTVPGTGKSFIGAILAKAFHDYTQETILVITYTNHALDQFLEDFLDIGIPSNNIVRLGSKSTPRTASLNLSEQKGNHKASQSVWNVIYQLNWDLSELQSDLSKTFRGYRSFSPRWKDIMEYLEFSTEYSSFAEALQTPEDEEDGMIMMDSQGKKVGPGYLYGRWCSGLNGGIFANNIAPQHQKYWSMDRTARQTYIDKWTHELLQEQVTSICGLIQRFDTSQGLLEEASCRKESLGAQRRPLQSMSGIFRVPLLESLSLRRLAKSWNPTYSRHCQKIQSD